RFTLSLSLLCAALAIGAVWLLGDIILGLFGANYVAQASSSARLLILAVLPIVIKTHYVAILRIQRRVGTAAVVLAIGGLLELTAAAVGAIMAGLPGLTVAWLLALCLEGAYMTPTVWHTATSPAERAAKAS